MKCIFTSGIIILLLAGTTHEATAGPLKLRLTDTTSGDTVTVEDLDGDGALTFNGTVGAFAFQVTTGISQPLLGNSTTLAKMHLSDASFTTSSGGTLEILLTDTDFDLAPFGPLDFLSQIGGDTDGPLQASTTIDLDNNEFALAGAGTTTIGHSPVASGVFSEEVTADVAFSGGPFSLTNRVLLTLPSESAASFDLVTTLVPIPEPGTLPLALVGVSAAVIWYQRQRRLLARLAR